MHACAIAYRKNLTLQFYKVSAKWVPRQLTPELKQRRVDAYEELLRLFEAEGDGFLAIIVTSAILTRPRPE
ncbi:hypothetical protein ANN_00945 [Periplaneta americana]|uniref:Uncharacterized protein n=1 Tax=Periplaneta americana TaxID=6978 RepID=A0ABQ8TS65_PERAM|nr:hypothetical protein ANN_00945 [Periplaneta americana]